MINFKCYNNSSRNFSITIYSTHDINYEEDMGMLSDSRRKLKNR